MHQDERANRVLAGCGRDRQTGKILVGPADEPDFFRQDAQLIDREVDRRMGLLADKILDL